MKNESKIREASRDASWIAGVGICKKLVLRVVGNIQSTSIKKVEVS
jgi:hypothetical protein